MMAKPVLGRGLGSLIPQASQAAPVIRQVVEAASSTSVKEVPIDSIRPNPHQPRHHFSAADLEDLLNSIKEHGLLNPIVVTKSGDGYELIAGERRWRASKMLGKQTIPAIVRDASDQQKLELAIIENVQRADLNALEEAIAFQALMDQFNLTQEAVAQRVGKSRSAVANTIRLLELPPLMQEAVRDSKITKSHARTLLAQTDPAKRQALFEAMLRGEITVRAAEAAVGPKRAAPSGPSARRVDPNILAHEKRIQEILGTKVEIRETGGKGTVTLHFYSKEDLVELLHRLSEM